VNERTSGCSHTMKLPLMGSVFSTTRGADATMCQSVSGCSAGLSASSNTSPSTVRLSHTGPSAASLPPPAGRMLTAYYHYCLPETGWVRAE